MKTAKSSALKMPKRAFFFFSKFPRVLFFKNSEKTLMWISEQYQSTPKDFLCRKSKNNDSSLIFSPCPAPACPNHSTTILQQKFSQYILTAGALWYPFPTLPVCLPHPGRGCAVPNSRTHYSYFPWSIIMLSKINIFVRVCVISMLKKEGGCYCSFCKGTKKSSYWVDPLGNKPSADIY